MTETSLARQLKKLAVPQTTILIQDKIRKSFLFDHRDAAGLDRELVFAYGTTGLQKLCTINPLFSEFETNLFSVSYKNFERSVQSTDANQKLDAKISEFLRMLSPYFLLREAHEALEWLVYRFHVHLYNVDELIACALPHYNTSYFVRVVQLLDLEARSRWLWLKPIQKTGVHLDYTSILNCFLTDASFRKFVCNIAPSVLSAFKEHKNSAVPVISFSMLTIRNALEKCKLLDDKLIISLFPYIMTGLSSNLTTYILGSYMVISQIIMKIKLNPDIVDELLIKIFQVLNDDLKKEALIVLLLVYQTQSVKSIPKKVYSIIFSSNETVKVLLDLLTNVKVISLENALIKKAIFVLFTAPCSKVKKNQKELKFFIKFLNYMVLEEKCASFIFNCIVKNFCKSALNKKNKKNLKFLKNIFKYVLKKLELKYPNHFDKVYKRFLEKPHPKKKMLCNLISRSVCSVKHEVIPDVLTTLSLGLYHINPNIRQTSVEYLKKILAYQNFSENEFIINSIYDRLLDDNPEVVLTMLSSSDTFMNLLSKPKVLSVFENIFSRQINLQSKWYVIQMKSLDIIIKLFGSDESMYDALPTILNYIFPVNEHTVEGFCHLMNSKLNDIFLQKMLNTMKSKFGEGEDIKSKEFSDINHMVINCLKEFIDQMDENSKIMFSSLLKSRIRNLKSSPLLVLYIYVMQFMLTENCDSDQSLLCINDLIQVFYMYFIQSNKLLDLKDILIFFKSHFPNKLVSSNDALEEFKVLYRDYSIEKSLHSLNKRQFPASLIYYTFFKIVSSMKLNVVYKSWINVYNGNSCDIVNCLFDFCVVHLNSDKELLQEYFHIMLSLLISCQLKTVQNTLSFLSTKWLTNSENLAIKLTCTSIATTLIDKKQMDWVFDKSMIFFCTIKLIADSNDMLRHNSLNLLHLMLLSAKDCAYPLIYLGNEIFSKSEEIKTDYKQCFDCVGTWLNSAVDNVNVKKSKQTELQMKINVLNQILKLLNENEVPYSMKYFLLSCLQNVNNTQILSSYVPVIYSHLSLLKETNDDDKHIFEIIHLLLKKFTAETATCLTDSSAESKALLYCLNFNINRGNDINIRVQTLTLDILSEEFYSAIPSIAVQQEILENLLTFYMTSPININIKVERVLRHICRHAYLFFKHLKDQELSVSKNTTLREVKKVRITKNSSDNVNNFEGDIWKKITVFLELIQSESNFLHKEILIPELFNLLNKSLDFDTHANVEYIKQLILSNIFNCCEQYGSQQNLEKYFQVELIVQCIRSSTNPKTHRQALLLLNLAAAMFPDHVLKNVMSIFVFMGSSLVRQDNSYSFQVISQTIETVLPSLCEASHQQTKTDGDQVVASVIRVFVDSLLDIPGHRQLPLFTKLITTLDPSKFLWIPLGQICDQYATVFHNISPDSLNWKVSPTLEFAVNLHKQFSPDIQIDTCIKLIDFLLLLPDTKKQLELNPDKYEKMKEPFDVVGHSDKELQIYKHNVLSYMKIWLSSQAFHSQVSELSLKEQSNLEARYERLLESVLVFLQDRLNSKKCDKSDKIIGDQVLLLYDLVYAINSLLPSNLFIYVIRRLLKNDDREIQLRAVELLSAKLEQQRELFGPENHALLLKLLKPLLKLVGTSLNENNDKYSVVQQNALYALHLLCKLIGTEYPHKFYKVLNVAVSVLEGCAQPELFVNALLCLAQLCRCLNVDILPRLNTFMPAIINILHNEKVLDMSECFILGVATALHSIIENLGIFLSSYLEEIISSICIFSLKYFESSKKTASEKFEDLQSKLSNEIPLRILLPAIEKCFSKLHRKNTKAIVPLMKILTQKLDCSEYEDILSCITQLQNFFISLLDFRNSNQNLSTEIVSLVENSIISSLQTFVMKLSVSRFRTFFQKVYQWAVVTIEDQEQKYRIFTFYKVTGEFSKSLKSLFSPMSRYLFTHISVTLDSCNASKSKVHYFVSDTKLSHELLINILDTLKFCFMYSEEQLLDKENFDLLMHPIVNQTENLDDESMYKNLIENHLSSCIAYFMTAVSDSTLWKALNYQILLKTRHESSDVRFGSLQIILEVVKKMGDNYLVLLPESIPFLAEIMEDESTEVEQECQTVIIEMEKILGEPIRKYF